MKTKYQTQRTEKVFFIIILMMFLLKGFLAQAQHNTSRTIYRAPYKNTVKKFAGYEIVLGAPSVTIKSDIKKIHDITINSLGGRVGTLLGTEKLKAKAYVGLFYPANNTGYDFDVFEGGTSANIYLLQLNKVSRENTIEPYIVID